MSEASLEGADLRGVDLRGVGMSGVLLIDTWMDGTHVYDCVIPEVGTDMSGRCAVGIRGTPIMHHIDPEKYSALRRRFDDALDEKK